MALLAAATIADAQEGSDVLVDTVDNSAPDDLAPPKVPEPSPFPIRNTIDEEPVRPQSRRLVRDEQDQLGIGQGPMKLFGTLETAVIASSNPARRSSNRKGDVGFRIAPALRLDTDWSRHDLVINANGEWTEYASETVAASRQAKVDGTLRLDIRRATFSELSVGYELDDQRDTSEQGSAPERNHTLTAAAGLTHDFGQLEGEVTLRLTRFIAEDSKLSTGVIEDNSDRAYTAPELVARVALRPDAPISPFVEVALARRVYNQSRDRFGNQRDANGLRAALGVAFNDAPLWEGSMAATYLLRDFKGADLASVSAIGLAGNLIWRPTDFASFTITTGVDLNDTRNAGEAATRVWTAGAVATYGVTDFIDLSARVTFTLEDGAGPSDLTTELGLGTQWQMTPFVALALNGENTWFDSGSPDQDYSEQRLIASLILQR